MNLDDALSAAISSSGGNDGSAGGGGNPDAGAGASGPAAAGEQAGAVADAGPARDAKPEGGPARGPDGKFAAKPQADQKAPVSSPPPAGSDAKATAPAAVPSPEALKPPQSWNAEEREHWASMSPVAQKAAIRRETEIQRGLQEAAGPKRFHDEFSQAWRPVEGLFAGQNPLEVTRSLLQTAAQLRTAPAQDRAAILWKMAQAHGVSVDHLAAVIDGTGQPIQAQQLDTEEIIRRAEEAADKRWEAREQQRVEQGARSELAAFVADHEFYNDVRLHMQGLLQSRAATTLQEAYEAATYANPKVRAIIQQREAAKAASAAAPTQRMATTSPRPEPAAARVASKPSGLDDAVAAAIAGSR